MSDEIESPRTATSAPERTSVVVTENKHWLLTDGEVDGLFEFLETEALPENRRALGKLDLLREHILATRDELSLGVSGEPEPIDYVPLDLWLERRLDSIRDRNEFAKDARYEITSRMRNYLFAAQGLNESGRVSGESATTPAQESTNEDDNASHMGDAVDGGARTNDGCLDDHSLTSPAPPPCEWQFVKGTVCGKPSAERLVLTPIPDKERWAESAVDLCRRHVRMAREGRCEGYRSAVEVECSYEKHRPGGASPTPTDDEEFDPIDREAVKRNQTVVITKFGRTPTDATPDAWAVVTQGKGTILETFRTEDGANGWMSARLAQRPTILPLRVVPLFRAAPASTSTDSRP